MKEPFNLCDGCMKWPCGFHSPIGISGSITTECASRQPTSGAMIARLTSDLDAIRKAAKRVIKVYPYDIKECAERRGKACKECQSIIDLQKAISEVGK